ncbi:monovalent cation/H+ antiporter subunit D [Xinfangfangia sp. CPCC 101601]|uniref:Monovalent cation/H+ antiporter subunit D n=1 Tax=Pseudogemmobacter lacusdianii TaxID=3069608 RepID=A0ABU0VZY5_9RHOB|nr:monovalent cation/H+ antiporter subunit D [Xinfangfangia sp. CPCC 101601]MDQ2067311.1 monovalent cation/H+ antiporter subunit D [Xinfangfangia sp. CPCC 101601]
MLPGPDHLIILPILIPFFAGALMLIYDERQRRAKLTISMISVLASLWAAVELLIRSKGSELTGNNDIGFYLLGDWAAPYGIILVIDRLSAMMLVLTGLLALPALTYASAAWARQGQHFHSMFQFLLMGLNGAFLTGDLFNLFVFFEVLLAASYGLLLHGGGQLRVRGGLHYIAINLTGSLLFLIGVSLVYGATGTLNMAQLSNLVPMLPEARRPLFHAGATIMGLAFLIKAGIWPLSFWLPTAYMAGAAPVAAIFAIMTKVGVYVIVRLSFLLFGPGAGASAGFGGEMVMLGGMATVTFGFIGVLASQGVGRMAAHLVLVSSGTVLASAGFVLSGQDPQILAASLYYMLASTLAISALFLLIEPMGREDGGIAALLALTADAYGLDEREEDRQPEVGLAIPGTLTVLGLAFFACVLVLAGLPPLAGFIGKLGILQGLLMQGEEVPRLAWIFVTLLIVSGFATLIGLVRVGIQTFWASEGDPPRVLALEIAPVMVVVGLLILMTVKADVTLRYMLDTADAVLQPSIYAEGVLGAPRAADEEAEVVIP